MNHVKFMFNRINNYDLLYEDIMEGNQEWGENTKRVEDHTKEYLSMEESGSAATTQAPMSNCPRQGRRYGTTNPRTYAARPRVDPVTLTGP